MPQKAINTHHLRHSTLFPFNICHVIKKKSVSRIFILNKRKPQETGYLNHL